MNNFFKVAKIEEGDWVDRWMDQLATSNTMTAQHPLVYGLGSAVPYVGITGVPAMLAKMWHLGITNEKERERKIRAEMQSTAQGPGKSDAVANKVQSSIRNLGGILGAAGGGTLGYGITDAAAYPPSGTDLLIGTLLGIGGGGLLGYGLGHIGGSFMGRSIRDRVRAMATDPGRLEAAAGTQAAHPYATELPFGSLIAGLGNKHRVEKGREKDKDKNKDKEASMKHKWFKSANAPLVINFILSRRATKFAAKQAADELGVGDHINNASNYISGATGGVVSPGGAMGAIGGGLAGLPLGLIYSLMAGDDENGEKHTIRNMLIAAGLGAAGGGLAGHFLDPKADAMNKGLSSVGLGKKPAAPAAPPATGAPAAKSTGKPAPASVRIISDNPADTTADDTLGI